MTSGRSPYPGPAATIAERLRFQSAACGFLGSPLYEGILARAAEDFDAGGPTAAILTGHEEDRGESALALRMMGAVNRLVVGGELPELAARYASEDGDGERTWEAFLAALAGATERIRGLVELPVQTNEVGRCAALLPGFLAVAAATGLPLRVLEVGASAGLNLRWSAFRYEAAATGFAWGPSDSPLAIDFELTGGRIPPGEATVAERIGCDASPVDPGSEEGRLTLLAYVWPDQTIRVERMHAALGIAERLPAVVERARAVEWITRRLAEPTPGLATVVYHSIVMQYLQPAERDAFASAMAEAGERADAAAPLAWLRMEPDFDRAEVRLTTWPGGEDRQLLRAGYHGSPVELSGGLVDESNDRKHSLT